jgi:hypothetical protein
MTSDLTPRGFDCYRSYGGERKEGRISHLITVQYWRRMLCDVGARTDRDYGPREEGAGYETECV